MILDELAAHPATPRALLADLIVYACSPQYAGNRYRPLAAALARNPALSLQDLAPLLQVTTANATVVVQALMERPDVDAAAALRVLDGHDNVTFLLAALERVPDPDGHLVRAATSRAPTGSVRLWTAALRNPATPADVRDRAVLFLVGLPRPRTTHLDLVRAHICERLRSDHPAGSCLLSAALEAAGSKEMRESLVRIDPTPGGDRRAWLSAASTPVADVIDYARSGTESDWRDALDTYPDPDGDLARAAWDAHPGSASIRNRLLRSASAPLEVRTAVASAMSWMELCSGVHWSVVEHLLHVAPLTWVREVVEQHSHMNVLHAVTGRPDLTSDDVAALHDAHRRAVDALAGMMPSSARLDVLTSWNVFTATHPATAADLRQQAAQSLVNAQPTTPELGPLHLVGRAVRDLDPADPASVCAAGASLPLAVLTPQRAQLYPGVRWLVSATLGDLAPALTGTHAHAALHALCQSPPKDATIGDILRTAATIAA